ncbi:AbrB family transcriptional regulator [Bacillus thuringiensis serovar pingluonsis]|uniref:AbrB family transcriptional regulator n=1 Tax=Bacillus thuringiensis serovar pingluonsis TaxID=180881 RepID=A0A243BE25_BACTU|nr:MULTISPECIES: AbrB/MazE/SpoVT family DNA-binding domain-containing protein [Bacillus cereus group]MEB9683750.1 AbrB/MazE/SpoVT family DNA-binding domain-containing protein [Bacillus anthracis]OTY44147.1 AbrB family transcriptional regulator [Bacillus thuringiensis serovar pingluonsis]
MKNTGIVRRIDDLGRVCIPKELRRTLGWPEETALEIHVDGKNVVLAKHEKVCVVTGEASDANIELFDGQVIVSQKGAKLLIDSIFREGEKRGWLG